jgi:hypothetical protein
MEESMDARRIEEGGGVDGCEGEGVDGWGPVEDDGGADGYLSRRIEGFQV